VTEKKTIRYEDNAELRTDIVGWVCKTCGLYYGNRQESQHMASCCCCTDRPCSMDGCDGRAVNRSVWCPACTSKRDLERFVRHTEKAWEGQPLVASGDDRYFWTLDDLLEYLETDTPTAEQIDDMRLMICVPHSPELFSIIEWLEDYLAEDCDPPGDWEAAEKAVNDYLAANPAISWIQGKFRPTTASIMEAIRKESNE
jgi:hypothetical protein